ncbi:MAG TPA: CoA-binding protein [Deltaproteobacteria bacterium]|nr:CoA-binding protein [Deltaproteobacteria bacterium]
MDGRESLLPIFAPRSVAVVGATDRAGKLSQVVMANMGGFGGELYAVNPAHESVAGRRCYPSLAAIGVSVDLAVLAVPAAAAVRALDEARGCVRAAVVVSGGFGEAGREGRELEARLVEIARRDGVRLVGPNCLGIYDTLSGVDTFFIPRERSARPGRGPLSILSQSGSFAVTAMDLLAYEGLGVARVVSYGNKSDVGEADCLDFLADDEATSVVALYIEGVDDGRRFVEAAARCAARKPVMAVKVGREGAGVKAALSHTGAVAGRYELYRAAFREAGVIELGGFEELMDGCKALSFFSPARGRRCAVITDGGGMGVNTADALSALGLDVAELPGEVKRRLEERFPSYFAVSNPMDLTGSVTDRWFADAVEAVLDGDFYDVAVVAALWGPPRLGAGLADLVAEAAGRSGKPVLVCSPGGEYTRRMNRRFESRGIPVFPTPEAAARAAAVLCGVPSAGAAAASSAKAAAALPERAVSHARRIVGAARAVGRRVLTEPEAKEIVGALDIAVPRSVVVEDAGVLAEAARALTPPLVLKAVSTDIVHKSDVGALRLGIDGPEGLERAWAEIASRLAGTAPGARIEGLLVEETAPSGGVELIVGAFVDGQFGPAVMVGTGGVAVELFKDVTFRLAPVDEDEALAMVAELRGYALLAGYRGLPPRDLHALAASVAAVSRLISQLGGLREMEINPLIAYERGVLAVDARVVLT